MLRYLIGYILGTVMGIFLFGAMIAGDGEPVQGYGFVIGLWFAFLITGLTWSHRHHIKKRDEYNEKLKGGDRFRLNN